MLGKALVVWLAQLLPIVVLGGLPDKFPQAVAGEHRAHQVGTDAASLFVLAITCAFMPWLAPAARLRALGFEAFWLVLAVAREFGVFHFIRWRYRTSASRSRSSSTRLYF